MQSRRTGPAITVPGLVDTLQALSKAASKAAEVAGVPGSTIELVGLWASQINGCAVCLDMHSRSAMKAGETNERLFTLARWRETPYFTEAERAALALIEVVCRLADRTDPIPAEVFGEAAKHYDEPALVALVVAITAINALNRINVVSGQVAGQRRAQWVA